MCYVEQFMTSQQSINQKSKAIVCIFAFHFKWKNLCTYSSPENMQPAGKFLLLFEKYI